MDGQKERQKETKHDSFSVGHEDGSPVEIEGGKGIEKVAWREK